MNATAVGSQISGNRGLGDCTTSGSKSGGMMGFLHLGTVGGM